MLGAWISVRLVVGWPGSKSLHDGGQRNNGRNDEQKYFDRAVDVILHVCPITEHKPQSP
jgi:hypothetical protein